MPEPESDVVASARSEAGGAARPFSWRFTVPLLIGSALNPINSSLIATALVPIAAGLHVRVGQTAALVTGLYLASAIAQPTAGKAAQVFGPRRVFLTGIALVAVGGTVGGLAQDLITLLISRVLIGSGAVPSPGDALNVSLHAATYAGFGKLSYSMSAGPAAKDSTSYVSRISLLDAGRKELGAAKVTWVQAGTTWKLQSFPEFTKS
jgi:MFS family permease